MILIQKKMAALCIEDEWITGRVKKSIKSNELLLIPIRGPSIRQLLYYFALILTWFVRQNSTETRYIRYFSFSGYYYHAP